MPWNTGLFVERKKKGLQEIWPWPSNPQNGELQKGFVQMTIWPLPMPQAPSLARAARRCCFCSVLFCHFKRLFELWLNTDWKIRASKMYPGIRLFFACNVHSCITILSASGANMEGSKASILAEDSSTPRLSLAFDQILFVRYPESITEKITFMSITRVPRPDLLLHDVLLKRIVPPPKTPSVNSRSVASDVHSLIEHSCC